VSIFFNLNNLLFFFLFLNSCRITKSESLPPQLLGNYHAIIGRRLRHHILVLNLPDYEIAVMVERLLPLLMIDQDNNLYQGTPADRQHGMRSIHVIRGHAMAPRESHVARGVLFREGGRGVQGVENLVVRRFGLTDEHPVGAPDSCHGVIIIDTLPVNL
jgi:hypothetical protein